MRVAVTGMGGRLGTRVAACSTPTSGSATCSGSTSSRPRRHLRRAEFHRIDPRDRERTAEVLAAFAPTVLVHLGVYEPYARSAPARAIVPHRGRHHRRLRGRAVGPGPSRPSSCGRASRSTGGVRRHPVRPDESVPPAPRRRSGSRCCTSSGSLETAPARPTPPSRCCASPRWSVPTSRARSGGSCACRRCRCRCSRSPRFCVLHQDDAAEAIVAAVERRCDGPVNVVGRRGGDAAGSGSSRSSDPGPDLGPGLAGGVRVHRAGGCAAAGPRGGAAGEGPTRRRRPGGRSAGAGPAVDHARGPRPPPRVGPTDLGLRAIGSACGLNRSGTKSTRGSPIAVRQRRTMASWLTSSCPTAPAFTTRPSAGPTAIRSCSCRGWAPTVGRGSASVGRSVDAIAGSSSTTAASDAPTCRPGPTTCRSWPTTRSRSSMRSAWSRPTSWGSRWAGSSARSSGCATTSGCARSRWRHRPAATMPWRRDLLAEWAELAERKGMRAVVDAAAELAHRSSGPGPVLAGDRPARAPGAARAAPRPSEPRSTPSSPSTTRCGATSSGSRPRPSWWWAARTSSPRSATASCSTS